MCRTAAVTPHVWQYMPGTSRLQIEMLKIVLLELKMRDMSSVENKNK